MINPTGEIRIPVKSTTYKKTYKQINDLVNHMFPLVGGSSSGVSEEFGTFNYWSLPPPKYDLDWQ